MAKPKGRPLQCKTCPAGNKRPAYMPGPFCATCRREENKRLAALESQKMLDKIRIDAAKPVAPAIEKYPNAERGPACSCGMKPQHLRANAFQNGHGGVPIYHCLRHPERTSDGR